MLSLTMPMKSWLYTAIMSSPAIPFVLPVVFALLLLFADKSARDSLQPIPTLITFHWFALRRNHALHMRALQVASVLVIVLGSISLTYVILGGYVPLWLAMPLSMPLIVSVFVTILIGLIPGLLGAPMLVYLNRYPPDTWMSSRVARLSRPR